MKIKKHFEQYVGVREIISTYWRIYGGFYDLLRSPYLHVSIVFSLLLFPLWSSSGWWNDVLTIIPSIIGFSLGGYAIWLAMGDDSFRNLMCGNIEGEESSPYLDINAAFVHFIVVQFLSLFVALTAKAYYSLDYIPPEYCHFFSVSIPIGLIYNNAKLVLSFLGYFLFIYALMSALAATFAILRYSTWYDDYVTHNKNKK